jgi:hypothetical protein
MLCYDWKLSADSVFPWEEIWSGYWMQVLPNTRMNQEVTLLTGRSIISSGMKFEGITECKFCQTQEWTRKLHHSLIVIPSYSTQLFPFLLVEESLGKCCFIGRHMLKCKRLLLWFGHACNLCYLLHMVDLLVAFIVQAGPQLHANGEVPEKCNHFSQPLVCYFLSSCSRRRILCNDFLSESNPMKDQLVKKENHFETWNDSTRF